MRYVPKSITRTVGRTVLKSKNSSPQLLFVAGLVGFGTTVVLACKATMKVEDILVDHEKRSLEIQRTKLTEKQSQSEQRNLSISTAVSLSKIYAPSVVVGVVSVVCLTKSHKILNERNATLTAAYVGLQRFLEDYRGRVREKVGAEAERDVYYASTPVELVRDTPDGPQKYFGSRPMGASPYSCVFDETKTGIFQESYEFNTHFVRIQQDLLTNKLRSQGYLFLNDVYKAFGVRSTETGQLCGWFVGDKDSDDYVDISMTPLHDGRGSILLDFNVAGHVSHMLGDGSSNDSDFRMKMFKGKS